MRLVRYGNFSIYAVRQHIALEQKVMLVMMIRQGTHRRRKVKSDGRDGNEKMGVFTRHYGGPRRIELASYQIINSSTEEEP